jgi:hypothetical protein
MFLECGTCNECCSGSLTGEARGIPFGKNKPCHFLIDQKCSIYSSRPENCKKFQCGWSQNLFVDWMKPELSGVLVSIEIDVDGKQFLKATIIQNKTLDIRAIPYLKDWVEKNNTYLVIVDLNSKTETKNTVHNMNRPSNNAVDGLEQLVVCLNNFNRKDLAEEVLEAFGNKAVGFDELECVAKSFFKIRSYLKTADYLYKAIEHTQDPERIYNIKCNLINSFNHANYPEKALSIIEECEAEFPNHLDLVLEKAFSLFLLNHKSKAEDLLRNTLKNFSDQLSDEYVNKIKFNLGTYHLYKDDFQVGMKLFLEEGAKMKLWNDRSLFIRQEFPSITFNKSNNSKTNFIKWDGEVRPGSTLIIEAEAGIGDEIINVRFVKKIQQMGINVYWFQSGNDRDSLVEVFRRHGVNVIRSIDSVNLPNEVYYAFSMHLPILLKLEYPDLWSGPYLAERYDYKNKWSWIKKGKPSIGIRWQGNPSYDQDLHRSLKLQSILNLFEDVDANLYSLQRDNGVEELSGGIVDLSSKLETWEDTLGAMSNMDLIITSCTSVAHASAACGFPTAVMVPVSAYYVWSHSTEQSPWYGDNVKIFRQKGPRVWDEPIEELKNYLKKIL